MNGDEDGSASVDELFAALDEIARRTGAARICLAVYLKNSDDGRIVCFSAPLGG